MKIRVLAFVALSATLPTRGSLACSCGWVAEPGTPLLANGSPIPSQVELSEQPFLFVGTFVSDAPAPGGLPAPTYGMPARTVATFNVEASWRGTLSTRTVHVYTSFAGGGCGYVFEPHTCYLVFATVRDDGLLFTDICGRTSKYEAASALLAYVYAYLGPPQYQGE